jgi:hypothetical protein
MSLFKKKKKLVDQDKLDNEIKDSIEGNEAQAKGLINKGLNCGNIAEPVPKFEKAPCERIIKNKNNAWIVLGRDRPYGKASGYGGAGATGAGSIDLVVGRKPLDPKIHTNPNFISDAARIYISQKTDIDKNMGLAKGRVGMSVARSAIGMKADAIRIVARRGIKLVTGPTQADRNNSAGERVRTVLGIDLIAGNDDGDSNFLQALGPNRRKLQPIPLGLNTRDAIDDTLKRVEELGSIVNWMMVHMCTAFSILAALPGAAPASMFAISNPGIPQPGAGPPGLVPLIGSYQVFNTNCDATRINYLLEGPSKNYICSRHNRTN